MTVIQTDCEAQTYREGEGEEPLGREPRGRPDLVWVPGEVGTKPETQVWAGR